MAFTATPTRKVKPKLVNNRVVLTEAEHERVKRLAAADGVSISEFIKQALFYAINER